MKSKKSMFWRGLGVGIAVLLFSCSGRLFGQSSSNTLIGTWRLVSWESRAVAGEVSYPLGEKPLGVLSYNSKGRMSAHLMRRNRLAFKSSDPFGGTPDETKAAMDSILAYFGTYTVDEKAKAVTHHVEGCSFPNWAGTELKRFFSFEGKRLTLRTEPFAIGGQTAVGVVVWERID